MTFKDVRRRPDREALMLATQGNEVLSWDADADDGEGLSVLLGYEPVYDQAGEADYRWHLSIAGTTRVPRWDEMVSLAHALRPGVMFCIPLPPRSFWLNEHELCLHVWEVKDAALEQSWRANPHVSPPT